MKIAIFYSLLFLIFFVSCSENHEEENNLEHESSYDAFAFYNRLQFYPQEQGLSSEFNNAYRQHLSLKNYELRRTNKWNWIGPDNISGRVLSIALNPNDTNELWAGTASSGLWYSKTGGIGKNAWTYVKTGFPVMAINAIAIDPLNKDNMYIGTGESYSYESDFNGKYVRTLRGSWGIGILKSNDAGKTWKNCLNWSKFGNRSIFKIIIDPNNSNTIYVASTHGIYKSTDKGIHWDLILDKKMSLELVLYPNSSNILLAGVGGIGADDYGIFKTTDAGNNWSKIDTKFNFGHGRIMIDINKNNPNKVFAVFSDTFKTIQFIRTNDFFKNISFHSLPDITSYQGWYVNGLISNGDGKEILAGGVDLFLDKSGTYNYFQRYQMNEIGLHSDFHQVISNPMEGNKIYFATDGGVYRTDDFGRNFYNCNSGLNINQFYSGSFSADGNFGIAGLQDNRSAIYTGSLNWELSHYGDGTASALYDGRNDLMFCSSQNLFLSKSINQGKTWSEILIDQAACFTTPFKMSPSNNKVLYAGSYKLYKSVDTGSKFTALRIMPDSTVINSIAISSNNSDFILIACLPNESIQPRIYKSTDGGKNIIDISSELPNRIISDMSIINSKEYIICLTGFGTDHIFKTIDGGKSWTSIHSNLPDLPYYTVWVSPFNPDIMFTGSDFGLYVSHNGGEEWKNVFKEDADILPIYDLIYTENERKLIVFTHGKGAFKIDPFDDLTSVTNHKTLKVNTQSFYLYNQLPDELAWHSDGYLYNTSGEIVSKVKNNLGVEISKLNQGIYFYKFNYNVVRIFKCDR